MRNKASAVCVLLLACAYWPASASAGLIVNGGFETGDFTGWSVSNNTDINGVDASSAHTGHYGAFFGQLTADGPVSISQNVATDPGQSYTLSFWVMAEPGTGFSGSPDEFSVSFGSDVLIDITNVDAFPYTLYTFNVTPTSSSSLVEFAATNDASFFDLDDVNLTKNASAVPEPTGIIQLAISAASLTAFIRSRRGKPRKAKEYILGGGGRS